MRLKALATAGIGSLVAAALANASESTPEYSLQEDQSATLQDDANLVEEDEVKRLEEIIVDATSINSERRPNTGRVTLQPLPVKISNASPLFDHYNIELIVRPVQISEDGTYIADKTNGRQFARVRVTLNTEGDRGDSRLRNQADTGERIMDLPEAIYAITEVRYEVSTFLGRSQATENAFVGLEPPFNYRFCMADRAIAFDVKNGETTDLGKLIVRGLERRFRQKHSTEHRPLLGFDVPVVDVSHPDFRNKAPEQAALGTIQFDPEGELCRSSSRHVPGWFTNDEIKDVFPQFHVASATTQ